MYTRQSFECLMHEIPIRIKLSSDKYVFYIYLMKRGLSVVYKLHSLVSEMDVTLVEEESGKNY
jgi:hypothetical protein